MPFMLTVQLNFTRFRKISYEINGEVLKHCKGDGCDAAFMKKIVNKGIHDWYIKIENKFGFLRLGIFDNKFDPKCMNYHLI